MESNPKSKLLTLNLGSLAELSTCLPLKDCLKLRLVCKKLNQGVCYGWRLRIYELELLVKKSQSIIDSDFDKTTLKKHYELKDENNEIENKLKEYLFKSKGKGKLFPEVQGML